MRRDTPICCYCCELTYGRRGNPGQRALYTRIPTDAPSGPRNVTASAGSWAGIRQRSKVAPEKCWVRRDIRGTVTFGRSQKS